MQSAFPSFASFRVLSFVLFSSFFILLVRNVSRKFVLEKNARQGLLQFSAFCVSWLVITFSALIVVPGIAGVHLHDTAFTANTFFFAFMQPLKPGGEDFTTQVLDN